MTTKNSKKKKQQKKNRKTQEGFYAIFFSGEDVVIQVPVEKGKKVLLENTTKM